MSKAKGVARLNYRVDRYNWLRKRGICTRCGKRPAMNSRCMQCARKDADQTVKYQEMLNNKANERRINRMLSLSAFLDRIRKRLEVA